MNEEKKTFDIYPAKKGRRILVFLSDILIFFISAVFLFEMIGSPIMNVSINYPELMERVNTYYESRDTILKNNNLLKSHNSDKTFEEDLTYTSEEFIKAYVLKEDLINNDPFYNYYVNIKGENINVVNDYYKQYGESYFDFSEFTSIGTYSFNEETIDLIYPKYDPTNEISDDGNALYTEIQNNLFLVLYRVMLSDIIENDLIDTSDTNSISFNEYSILIDNEANTYEVAIKITSLIVFIITSAIFFILIPLLNFKGRTIGEMILKVEHIDITNYHYLKKRFITVTGLFNILNSTAILFLIPVISLGFSRLFTLNELVSVSIIGILFIIIEMLFLFINQFSRTIKEFGTHSIVVDTETMDEYYKIKGLDF